MAGSKTNFLEDELIDHVLRGLTYGSPATVYVALYTAAPSDAGGGTEVADAGAYARQSVTFAAPSPEGQTQNSVEIAFPVATANWGTVVAFAIHDDGAWGGGNMLYWGDLDTSKTVNTDDQLKFAIGALQVDED